MSPHRSDPRRLALRILSEVETSNAHAGQLIAEALGDRAMRPDDAALLHELVLGVLRWQRRLDFQIDRLSHKGIASLPPPIVRILRLALYQLEFLDRIPPHAAVDQAVRQVRAGRTPGLAGVVNALLRHAPERIPRLEVPAEPRADFLGIQHSFPTFLVQRWLEELGEPETLVLLGSLNERPALCIRVNLHRTSPFEFHQLLAARGVDVTADLLHPAVLRLPARTRIDLLPGYHEGLFTVQDTAATLVGQMCFPAPGPVVLDVCAAPGGKATHLAELAPPDGRVYAVDRSYARLARLRENVRRTVAAIEIIEGDARGELPGVPAEVDLVLADVPCSGLGALRRKPDLRWRLAPEDIPRLAGEALEMLEATARRVRPGGALVYSTCTLTPEENTGVIQRFLAVHPEWQREDARQHLPAPAHVLATEAGELLVWPHRFRTDGAFAARLRRGDSPTGNRTA